MNQYRQARTNQSGREIRAFDALRSKRNDCDLCPHCAEISRLGEVCADCVELEKLFDAVLKTA